MITSVNQRRPCPVEAVRHALRKGAETQIEESGVLDLIKIITDLRQERDKLQAIIVSLEQLQLPGTTPSQLQIARRGRRSMDAAGRLEVSRRMKQYWENRRKQDDFGGGPPNTGHSSAGSLTI